MVIECPKCKKQYNVDGSRVTEQGVKITCPACQHQFIVRRKQDEPAKAEPKKPKTPPCVLCGEPSTHVLKGPPPRPMCEYHYRVEKEKESRFFDSIPETAAPQQRPPYSDPGATRIEPSARPGATVRGQTPPGAIEPPPPASPPPAKPAVPGKVAEPAFESFDDDFDFTDADSQPPRPAPEKAAPPAPAAPADDDEEIPLADPHEFLARLNADVKRPDPAQTMPPAPAKPEPPPAKPAPLVPPQPPTPETPPAKPEPDASFDFDEPAAKTVKEQPSAAADPFRPEPRDMGTSSPGVTPRPGSVGAGRGEARPAKPASGTAMDFDQPEPGPEPARKFDAFNLDGTPVEERYAEEAEDQDVSYEWRSSAAGQKSRAPSLDEELAKSLTLEGEDEARSAAARPSAEEQLQAARPVKQRSMASAVMVLIVLLAATAASGFLSLSGKSRMSAASGEEVTVTAPQWQGRLGEVEEQTEPIVPMELPALAPGPGADHDSKSAAAEDRAQAALRLMYRDSRKSYDQALKNLDNDLNVFPQNPALLAAKIDIIAFRESRDDKGKSVLRGDESKREFSALDSSIQDSPPMTRAKAHVLLNDQKTVAARAILKTWLDKNPRDAVAMCLMGLTYRYQPNPDLNEAARNLESAVKTDPNLVAGYWDLAEIYRQLGRYDDAVDMYNEVLTRSPDREGTAEAMEDTMRQKTQGGPRQPAEAVTQPLITIPVQVPPENTGLAASGTQVSDNILEIINLVEPRIRNLDLTPLTKPSGPQPRALPRPPEEAP